MCSLYSETSVTLCLSAAAPKSGFPEVHFKIYAVAARMLTKENLSVLNCVRVLGALRSKTRIKATNVVVLKPGQVKSGLQFSCKGTKNRVWKSAVGDCEKRRRRLIQSSAL